MPAAAKLQTKRLLIVDDDPSQATIIRRIGEQEGFACIIAQTFDCAVKYLEDVDFDVVTIDLSLGHRDGVEVLRAINGLSYTPRIVFISGHDRRILETAVRMAASTGSAQASALQKPFKPAGLRELLKARQAGANNRHGTRTVDIDSKMILAGLANREFFPLFQPKVSLGDGHVVGCEALARWRSSIHGQISPDNFIPIAEADGSIVAITNVILEQSVKAAAKLITRVPGFTVSVNISPLLLSDLSLPEQIDALLKRYSLPAECLTLEVTESAAMLDVIRATDILLRLRIKGVGLSIDDFGTGYSSFAALAQMPFTELKIDRSFVTNYLTDASLRKIVRGSIALGHEFNLKVVAEGVENAPLAASLAHLGCDVGQGYLYAPALPLNGFLDWMEHRATGADGKRQLAACS